MIAFQAHSWCLLIRHPLCLRSLLFVFLVTLFVGSDCTANRWLVRAIIYSHSCFCRLAGVRGCRVDSGGQCCFKEQILLGLTPCDRFGSVLLHICVYGTSAPGAVMAKQCIRLW